MPWGLGECDLVQGSVQLTVSAAAQPVPGFLRRLRRQGRGAVVASVGVAGLESVDAGGFADGLGCGQRSASRASKAGGHLLDQLRDLFLQGIDQGSELGAPADQFSG